MDVNAAKKMPFVKKAIASAKSAISWFEKEYPRDKKPRKAIEAAEAWMKNPTEKNRMKAILADSAAYSSASAANFDTYESASAASASHAAEAAAASCRQSRLRRFICRRCRRICEFLKLSSQMTNSSKVKTNQGD